MYRMNIEESIIKYRQYHYVISEIAPCLRHIDRALFRHLVEGVSLDANIASPCLRILFISILLHLNSSAIILQQMLKILIFDHHLENILPYLLLVRLQDTLRTTQFYLKFLMMGSTLYCCSCCNKVCHFLKQPNFPMDSQRIYLFLSLHANLSLCLYRKAIYFIFSSGVQ